MISEKSHFHIVLTTHNSRVSERMKLRGINPGRKIALGIEEEIYISFVIGQVLLENAVTCPAYNICGDHVHILILEVPERISHIIKLVKGRSSFLWGRRFSSKTKGLWSQKFFYGLINDCDELKLSNVPGEIYSASYLDQCIAYIENNRTKHGLSSSAELRQLINSFVQKYEE